MKNENYKSIIKELPIGYAYHNIICNEEGIPCDYEFIEVNLAFESLTGLIGSEIVGKRISEIVPDLNEDDFKWIKVYGDIALNNGSKQFEQFSKEFNRWYKINAYSPEQGYFITLFSDISKERNDLEEKTILLTTMNDIIFELDEQHTVRNIINSDDFFLSTPKEEIIGKKIHKLFSEEIATLFIATIKEVVVSGQKKFIKYELPGTNENKWFEAEIFVRETVFNKKKYFASIREITERINIEDRLKNKTEELERFFNINLDLLCIADMQGNFIKINNAWEKILGYPAAELEKRRFLDFVHPEDMEATLNVLSELSNNQKVLNFINRYRCNDGSYRYIEWCSQPYEELIYAAARDITVRKQMEEKLLFNEERLDAAIKGTRAGLWDWNIKDNSIFYSQQWKSMLGYEQGEVLATFNGWKDLWHPEEIDRIEQAIKDYTSGKTDYFEIEYRLLCKNGEWRWILTRGQAMKDSTEEIYRWAGTNIDITHLKEAEGKIVFLSFHDQLTGLYNRRFYEEELTRVNIERNLPLSLIMADVNGLKLANDAFGHLMGDEILKKAAEAIKKECRSDEIISRIGGDEFTIVLLKTNREEAEALVKRITKAISNVKVDILDLSISFGWATKTNMGENIEDIFKLAEEKMYKRKLHESPKLKTELIKKMLVKLNEKFPKEKEHSEGVSKVCEIIGKQLGFGYDELIKVQTAGLLHDIGKINLSEKILYKAGKLNAAEWIEIRRHAVTGYQILNSVNDKVHIAKYVLQHHEHWDGTGYPDGLIGEEIPLQSRIIAIADAYDAMTSERSYRKKLSIDEAIDEIERNAGTQFDPNISMQFIKNIRGLANE